MQIKVPFRDIAIIIIICNRESFIWLKFHVRIFVILAHFADNLAHPDINLRSGSPAKNNSCSYQIEVEPTALSLSQVVFFVETCSFWGLNWVSSGSQYMHVKFRMLLFGGVRLKKQGSTRTLSRRAKTTTARGLFTTLGK